MIVTSCVVGILVLVLVASRLEQKEFIADIQRALDGEDEASIVRRRCREPEPLPFNVERVCCVQTLYDAPMSLRESADLMTLIAFREALGVTLSRHTSWRPSPCAWRS